METATSTSSTFGFSKRLYEFWLQHSDNFLAIEQHVQQFLPPAIQKMAKMDGKTFNILSIGAGNGENDLRILTEVIGCLQKDKSREIIGLCNTAIEPNPMHIQEYTALIKEKVQSLQKSSKMSIEFELENKTFEEYEKCSHQKNRFDMIQAVQSIRFLEDPRSALKYCYESELKDNGLIVFIMSSGNPKEVFALVESVLDKHRPPDQRKHAHFEPSNELLTDRAAHCERFPFYSTLDVTDILDVKSPNWSLVLDAVTCTDDFCLKAEPRVIAEVCEVVKEVSSRNNVGRLIVGIENEMVVLFKSSSCRPNSSRNIVVYLGAVSQNKINYEGKKSREDEEKKITTLFSLA